MHARAARRVDVGEEQPFAVSNRYRGYVLGLLVAVGVFGWVDRNVLAVLLQSIKLELDFTDTELGLLGGVAFGVFYATVGLPVAWIADRYNRRSLIAIALGLWSAMTALCGLASGFASLFIARVGVGIGEAGGAPPSQSLVADYFPPARRGFALAILYLYIPLGFVVGFLSGGWLNELVGWRLAFAAVGIPGVLLAVIDRLTLREPPRGYSECIADSGVTPTLASTLSYIFRRASLRHLSFAGAAHGIGAFAAAVWLPSYFIRVFGLSSGEAGTWMAIAYGCGGGAGVLCGGYVADLIVKKTGDQRWYAWGSASVILAAIPCAAAVYLTARPAVAVAALLLATMLGHMFLGPVMAMLQGLAELRRRAVAAAVYLFLVNLVSMGVGPVTIGIVSDRFSPVYGNDALRYALLTIVTVTSIWAAGHFMAAARTLRGDLERARNSIELDARL